VHGAPALSNRHGTATEHASPKGFRLALNPAASSQIGINQSAAVGAVATPNQQPNATRAPARNQRCHVRLSRSHRLGDRVNDSLPDLALVRARSEEYDVIMLSAVWMHLDEQQRRQAMPNVAALLRNGGVMIMSLRHGPVPPGRRMFEVSAEETIALAQPLGLRCVLNQEAQPSLRQPGVSWTRLAFRKAP